MKTTGTGKNLGKLTAMSAISLHGSCFVGMLWPLLLGSSGQQASADIQKVGVVRRAYVYASVPDGTVVKRTAPDDFPCELSPFKLLVNGYSGGTDSRESYDLGVFSFAESFSGESLTGSASASCSVSSSANDSISGDLRTVSILFDAQMTGSAKGDRCYEAFTCYPEIGCKPEFISCLAEGALRLEFETTSLSQFQLSCTEHKPENWGDVSSVSLDGLFPTSDDWYWVSSNLVSLTTGSVTGELPPGSYALSAHVRTGFGDDGESRSAGWHFQFTVASVVDRVAYHSADYKEPRWEIDNLEASRALTYWAQAYHIDTNAPDRYAVGEGNSNGPMHTADYRAP
jgi:hypothetical protein